MELRLGIGLWLLSWVPYGLILGLSGAWLTVAWTIEVLLGISGLAIVGLLMGTHIGHSAVTAVAWCTAIGAFGYLRARSAYDCRAAR
jgi:hypothetical protein